MTSLRVRLLVGAVLWTIGITFVVHVLSITLIHRFPMRLAVLHWILMLIIALGLIAAGLTQVRSGMSPIRLLRERLADLREGRHRRLEGQYPSEVQPLVEDLNALLDDRERQVKRAQSQAGDLAHGLKTPLAVLSLEAERAEAAGNAQLGGVLREQIERMHQHVEYHLAHARAAASAPGPDARASLRHSAEGLVRTLLRLHAERGLSVQVLVAPDHWVRVQPVDLDEMLGNLLDNAFKWARSRVTLSSAEGARSLVITVDDDGPGIEPSLRESALHRGVRGDEAAPGSGFGLAIVSDLAQLYGGSIALTDSADGGLRARLELPSG